MYCYLNTTLWLFYIISSVNNQRYLNFQDCLQNYIDKLILVTSTFETELKCILFCINNYLAYVYFEIFNTLLFL